jgi:hypothetical protein
MVRNRTKDCDRCQKNVDIMYRVQVDKSASWQLVCHDCQTILSNQQGYTYGGTWKARKR